MGPTTALGGVPEKSQSRDEYPAGKGVPRGFWAGGRRLGGRGRQRRGIQLPLRKVQAKQKKTFSFEILTVFACKMDPVLSSHFIDLAIFPESQLNFKVDEY